MKPQRLVGLVAGIEHAIDHHAVEVRTGIEQGANAVDEGNAPMRAVGQPAGQIARSPCSTAARKMCRAWFWTAGGVGLQEVPASAG